MPAVRIGNEFLVNTQTTSNQDQATIAGLSGGFVVSWTDASRQGGDTSDFGVKAQIFDGGSGTPTPLGSKFLVSAGVTGAISISPRSRRYRRRASWRAGPIRADPTGPTTASRRRCSTSGPACRPEWGRSSSLTSGGPSDQPPLFH